MTRWETVTKFGLDSVTGKDVGVAGKSRKQTFRCLLDWSFFVLPRREVHICI